MELKDYILKVSAAVLFTAAGVVYAFSSGRHADVLEQKTGKTVISDINKTGSPDISHDPVITDIAYTDPLCDPQPEDTAVNVGNVNKNTTVNDGTVNENTNANDGPVNENTTANDGPMNINTDANDGLVNINSADAEELQTLPGIGQSKAAAVIRYRTDHGGFCSNEDIMNVPGIKEGTYKKIKDLIKCR